MVIISVVVLAINLVCLFNDLNGAFYHLRLGNLAAANAFFMAIPLGRNRYKTNLKSLGSNMSSKVKKSLS